MKVGDDRNGCKNKGDEERPVIVLGEGYQRIAEIECAVDYLRKSEEKHSPTTFCKLITIRNDGIDIIQVDPYDQKQQR